MAEPTRGYERASRSSPPGFTTYSSQLEGGLRIHLYQQVVQTNTLGSVKGPMHSICPGREWQVLFLFCLSDPQQEALPGQVAGKISRAAKNELSTSTALTRRD